MSKSPLYDKSFGKYRHQTPGPAIHDSGPWMGERGVRAASNTDPWRDHHSRRGDQGDSTRYPGGGGRMRPYNSGKKRGSR
jgi:hypothetical protein